MCIECNQNFYIVLGIKNIKCVNQILVMFEYFKFDVEGCDIYCKGIKFVIFYLIKSDYFLELYKFCMNCVKIVYVFEYYNVQLFFFYGKI